MSGDVRWQAEGHDATIDLLNGMHQVEARDADGTVFSGSFRSLRHAKSSAEAWINEGKLTWLT